jgi:hypothetical protein
VPGTNAIAIRRLGLFPITHITRPAAINTNLTFRLICFIIVNALSKPKKSYSIIRRMFPPSIGQRGIRLNDPIKIFACISLFLIEAFIGKRAIIKAVIKFPIGPIAHMTHWRLFSGMGPFHSARKPPAVNLIVIPCL